MPPEVTLKKGPPQIPDSQRYVAKATITLPTISGAEVNIPGVKAGEIKFEKISASISSNPNGQRFEVVVTQEGKVEFRAVPNANGENPPFVLSVNAKDDKGENLSLSLISTTKASKISGSFPVRPGEIKFGIAGLSIGPALPDGKKSTDLNGKIVINGTPIDLNGLSTEGFIPGLEVTIDPVKKTITLRAQAVRPPAPYDEIPGTLKEWFKKDAQFWKGYQQSVASSTPLVRMPKKAANMPNASVLIPRGDGSVAFYLRPNVSGTDTFEVTANLDEASLMEMAMTMKRHLVIARDRPNPPPRSKDNGEPFAYSTAQNPNGTLFILPYTNADGEIQKDSDLVAEMSQALGISPTQAEEFVANGRIEIDEMTNLLLKDETIKASLSREDLVNFIKSYVNTQPNGTLRRNSHRLLVALRGLKFQNDAEKGLAQLLAYTDGKRAITSHEFLDKRFHTEIPGEGDGSDLQLRSVLAMTPKQAATLIRDKSLSDFDPWISKTTSNNKLTLLDRDYEVVRTEQLEGNVTLFHTRFKSKSGEAFSQTIRLTPVTVEGNIQTLVVMEEHRDQKGQEAALPFPRINIGKPITPVTALFNLNNILGYFLPPIGDLNTNASIQSMMRFCYMMTGLTQLDKDPQANAKTIQSSPLYETSGTGTYSAQILDYLALKKDAKGNPVLMISEEPRDSEVQIDLAQRLGIDLNVSQAWMKKRANPVAGETKDVRYIPLEELWKASELEKRGITFPVFQGLTHILLDPPSEMKEVADKMTSSKDRYFIFLQELRETVGVGEYDLTKKSGDAYPLNFRTLNAFAFHSKPTAGNTEPDTPQDTIISTYVEAEGGLTAKNIAEVGALPEEFHAWTPGNYPVSENLDPKQYPGLNWDKKIYSRYALKAVGEYSISKSKGNLTTDVEGGVSVATWQMEVIPGIAKSFYENYGNWVVIPVSLPGRPKGFVISRYSITNTTRYPDRDSVATGIAEGELPGFFQGYVRRALSRIGVNGSSYQVKLGKRNVNEAGKSNK